MILMTITIQVSANLCFWPFKKYEQRAPFSFFISVKFRGIGLKYFSGGFQEFGAAN
jgi:hypothetical protein